MAVVLCVLRGVIAWLSQCGASASLLSVLNIALYLIFYAAAVRAIAERFHGAARFSWKDQVFYASVFLSG